MVKRQTTFPSVGAVVARIAAFNENRANLLFKELDPLRWQTASAELG